MVDTRVVVLLREADEIRCFIFDMTEELEVPFVE